MHRLAFLVFVILTFICWGIYGPVLHVGQEQMGADGQLSSLRPFIAVGIAYFLIAVVYPLIVISRGQEPGKWTAKGFFWSFLAGAVGAVGALGIILAFKFRGSPVYVMPLVFGLAPVVNTLVTMLMNRTVRNASFIFFLGVLMVAIGAAGVLWFKPSAHHAKSPVAQDSPGPSEAATTDDAKDAAPSAPNAERATNQANEANNTNETNETNQVPTDTGKTSAATDRDGGGASGDTDPVKTDVPDAGQHDAPSTGAEKSVRGTNLLWVTLCILGTAVCWGSYGPVLHRGQALMGGSRLRPFLCVGLAYFAIAVVVPLLLMNRFPEPGGWTFTGTAWSLAAGAAGAIGALGIIYAFNYGGKPVFVMPLVFGFAPVVNTMTEIVVKQLYGQISPWFYASMTLVIVGAVTVLIFAPRGKPNPKGTPATRNGSNDHDGAAEAPDDQAR